MWYLCGVCTTLSRQIAATFAREKCHIGCLKQGGTENMDLNGNLQDVHRHGVHISYAHFVLCFPRSKFLIVLLSAHLLSSLMADIVFHTHSCQ